MLIGISYTLGCNKPMENINIENDSILIEWINQNTLSLISILLGILSISLMVYYNYQQQHRVSIELLNEENLSNKTKVIRNIPELPSLITTKPYVVFFIHRFTSTTTLNQLIMEAQQTKRFTIVPKLDTLYNDTVVIHIELIQQMQTTIILLDYFNENDMETPFFDTLCHLFSIIFNSSNEIQTWGNLIDKLKPFIPYKIYTINQMKQCQSTDIQKEFKRWYNKTFIHHIQCQQYLKYDNMDGQFCSCSHRPYKSISDNWSLLKAIAYTFDEYLYNNTFDITKCLAITKLADVIQQEWTIEQVEDYKKKYHINQKVKD